MNRPIEFRAMRADTKEWVFGYLADVNVINVPIHDESTGFYSYDDVLIIPETVGQFVGRTDVNGKKIFEGDKDESGYFIQYVDQYACFCYLDKDLNVAFQCVPTFFESIGTIHDITP